VNLKLGGGPAVSAAQHEPLEKRGPPAAVRLRQARGPLRGRQWVVIGQKALKLFSGNQGRASIHKMNTFN
jgi:hypothetical protein